MNIQSAEEYQRINKIRQEKIYQKIINKDTSLEFVNNDLTNKNKFFDDVSLENDPLENEIILNMGPQHPATHGVLRVLLKINGETVVKGIPELGYLHRGVEKLAENMGLHQFLPYTDRLDYLSPLANNVAWVLACENAIGIQAPDRANWIRTLCCELARISSHLMAFGSMAMDSGAISMLVWIWTEREKIYDIIELLCGARFTTSYTRIGGVANDISSETIHKLKEFLDQFPEKMKFIKKVILRNRIFVERFSGVCILKPERAIALGITGPILRASGINRDLRRDTPYLIYNDLDFDVITEKDCDNYARALVRIREIEESHKMLYQIIDKMPKGEIRRDDNKTTFSCKKNIYTKMEYLISDFHLADKGVPIPKGETYTAVEGSKGELGFFIVSNGNGHPWKVKIRSASAANLQCLSELIEGSMLADVVLAIGSLDPIMGEADK